MELTVKEYLKTHENNVIILYELTEEGNLTLQNYDQCKDKEVRMHFLHSDEHNYRETPLLVLVV